ncbi:electron transfer flavoprotein subunit alpha/FixB family protein [Faecalicatena sp. AGMB00832]|uniref:Electron transfer flavoprotein subunit alpha/FixB family protein n=1 Tax=Faecalicatena faecalis TaxID=2726362 RepID=A0ABS6D6K9_9FIRM|nr:electron transfer flavoprotein subunit alpha/FixB family protein [Faecalicatena faecalis]MBU3877141.1 electron transfer flavoprotein subunit alpha/FixB family protein [Faecalicatena faecalis]
MGALKVHQNLVDEKTAEEMCSLCPFGAITYEDGKLDIGAGCRMCKICVKKGVPGVITYEEDKSPLIDKTQWNGITVYAENEEGRIHPVTYELIGKARELAAVNGQQVYVLLIGNGLEKAEEELLHYGVDCVFSYEDAELTEFAAALYADVVEDFVTKVQPSVMMFGATMKGRSLAPRAAARFRTGLTADCTILEMKENTDLVQIRPAFGGNIMAQIITPNSRPQFCTVRYKVFSAPKRNEAVSGAVKKMDVPREKMSSGIQVLDRIEKPREIDIADADTIVAVGRGIRSRNDLAMAAELADLLNAQLACTRPLIEAGWFDAKHQIGLSGRTVKPKLLITLGISGSVQFVAGMRAAECIIAVNSDKNAGIFDTAHYGIVGDLYEVLPVLLRHLKGGAR